MAVVTEVGAPGMPFRNRDKNAACAHLEAALLAADRWRLRPGLTALARAASTLRTSSGR